jgi:hypothetical protein
VDDVINVRCATLFSDSCIFFVFNLAIFGDAIHCRSQLSCTFQEHAKFVKSYNRLDYLYSFREILMSSIQTYMQTYSINGNVAVAIV